MIEKSYCKINLGLSIINKREDGFHNLETIFVPCKQLFDTVEIEKSSTFTLQVHNADFEVETESNLCTKAYRLIAADYPISPVSITLTKNIPSGAGVGGGSGNAATVLRMLNTMFALQIPESRLAHYALQLGSDVPFFLKNTPMYATGRGEILTQCSIDVSKFTIEIEFPNIHIATKEAYANVKPKRREKVLSELIQQPIAEWKGLIINDFEEYAFSKHPELALIKEQFYQRGACYAAMSGSGAAIFGLFKQ